MKISGTLRVVSGPVELVDIRDRRRGDQDRRPVRIFEGWYAVVIDVPAYDHFIAGRMAHYDAATYLWLPSVQPSRKAAQGWVDQLKTSEVEA